MLDADTFLFKMARIFSGNYGDYVIWDCFLQEAFQSRGAPTSPRFRKQVAGSHH